MFPLEEKLIQQRKELRLNPDLDGYLDDVLIIIDNTGKSSIFLVPIQTSHLGFKFFQRRKIEQKLSKQDYSFLPKCVFANTTSQCYYCYFDELTDCDVFNMYDFKSQVYLQRFFEDNYMVGNEALQNLQRKRFFLFFDTETTGFPKNWNAPISDVYNWPRLVQLAWVVYDETGHLLHENCRTIYPQGFRIPAEASKVHGITDEIARVKGIGIREILIELKNDLQNCDFIVAHNLEYDEKIIACEFYRENIDIDFTRVRRVCTKEISTEYCNLPDQKWPTLQELYFRLFGKRFENSHDALVDIRATAECFWELERRGIVPIY